MEPLFVWSRDVLRSSTTTTCLSELSENVVVRRHPVEMAWDVILVLGLLFANGFVIIIVSKSRILWKPRHLLMVVLCGANLLMGVAELYGLAVELWPGWKLCVVYRMTMGIPIQVNTLLLTLISVDRFLAVQFPFFYTASVTNLHVLLASIIVGTVMLSLTGGLIYLGFTFPTASLSSQMLFLPISLTTCIFVMMYCNVAVLVIAKKQLQRRQTASCSCVGDCSFSGSGSGAMRSTESIPTPADHVDASKSPLIGKQSSCWDANNNNNVTSSQLRQKLSVLNPGQQASSPLSSSRLNYGACSTTSDDRRGILFRRALFPNIRRMSSTSMKFARSVVFLTVPNAVFLLPIIIIITLTYACDGGRCECGRGAWDYLLIHIRSVFPLQGIVDPVVYLTLNNETRRCSCSLLRRWFLRQHESQRPSSTVWATHLAQ